MNRQITLAGSGWGELGGVISSRRSPAPRSARQWASAEAERPLGHDHRTQVGPATAPTPTAAPVWLWCCGCLPTRGARCGAHMQGWRLAPAPTYRCLLLHTRQTLSRTGSAARTRPTQGLPHARVTRQQRRTATCQRSTAATSCRWCVRCTAQMAATRTTLQSWPWLSC